MQLIRLPKVRIPGFTIVAVAVLASCAFVGLPSYAAGAIGGSPKASQDTEEIALDPEAARQVKPERAVSSLDARQYQQAISFARDLLVTTTDPGELMQVEDVLIQATRHSAGCKAALDEVKQLLALVKFKRPNSTQELEFLNEKVAVLKGEEETYQKALAEQREIMHKHSGTAPAAEAAYRIARLACFYGTNDEALDALKQVIAKYSKLKEQIGYEPNGSVVGEAVTTVKELCLVRSGPEEAVRQLEDIATWHVLDEAGAHAYLCIGEIYRSQGKTELAEKAFVTVDRLYSSSPVRDTAMRMAGDMYNDVARVYENKKDFPNAVEAWKKAYKFYPDGDYRKYETAYAVGFFLLQIGKHNEAHYYLNLVLGTTSPKLASLREKAAYRDAIAYDCAGDSQSALTVLRKLISDSKNQDVKDLAQSAIESIEGVGYGMRKGGTDR